ncbi:beta strand repeat-containing protein [Deinococcus altitudinis]|uniref:beta strand repeat-containing protein n=1 Tax=Deinococcus altitudinis TaxID=468914 RepID=UPI003891AD3F
MKILRNTPVLWALTGLLAACGSQTSTAPAAANQNPEVSLKLADGTALSTVSYFNASEQLKISTSDIDGTVTKIRWVIDTGRPTERSGEYTGADVKGNVDFTLPALASGGHTINVTATDNLGGTGSVSGSFKVDAEAPVLGAVNVNGKAVVDGQALTFSVGDAVTLTTAATDTRGGGDSSASATVTRVYLGSSLVRTVATGEAVDLATLLGSSTSVNTVRVVTADSALNTSASRTFTVQLAAGTGTGTGGATAEPTLSWLAPTGDYVSGNGTVTLRASALKAGQDLSSQVTYTATCGVIAGSSWKLDMTCTDGSKQTITANLVDNGKNYTISKTITVDASDPTVQITKPQQGQTFTQNPITVSVTGTDAVSGLDRILVEASKDGVVFTQVGVVTAASGDVVWAPMNGTYTLRATATDKTGRSSTSTLTGIKVSLTSSDSTPPTVALTPIPATPQRAIISVTARASDADSGVAKVDLYDGGTLIESKATGVSGTYTFSLDTTKFTDGTHNLRAVAFDNAGLSTESSTPVTVDNTAPVVNWISPADGSVTGGSVTLNAVTSEGTVTYTVDGAVLTGNKATFSGDGTHTITAAAQDAAGNRTVNTIRVTSDATAPSAQITSPTSGSTLTSNPVTVAVTGTDTGSGIANLEVFANGVSVGTVGSASGNVTWTPTSGTYALTVVATDKAGNRSTAAASVSLTVKLATSDTTAPEFVGTPTLQPAPTVTYSRGVITVDGFARDAESGISQVALYSGGVKLSAIATLSGQPDGSSRYALTLDSKTLTDGDYTFTVQATNGVGLVSNKNVAVKIDNTAPSLVWNPPTTVGVGGMLTLNATTESGSTISYVSSCGAVTGTSWDYSSCPDGVAATLTATAADAAGNTTSQVRSIFVDLTAPTVQITGPQEGQKFTQNPVTISVSGTDNVAVDHIDVFDGTTKVGTVTSGQGSVTWVASNGNHALTAKGYDKAGNVTTSTAVNVTVAVAPGSSTITPAKPAATAASLYGTDPLYIAGLGSVTGTASSTATITSAQLLVDGQVSGTPSNSTNSASFNFDFSTLNEGLHNLALRWQDSASTVTDSDKLSIYVDKTAPSVIWNRPAGGSTVTGLVTLDTSVTDSGVGFDPASAQYFIDGSTTPLIDADTQAGFQFDTNGIVPGNHTITEVVTDRLGNRAQQSITVVTVTKPTVTITNAAALTAGPISGYVSVNVEAKDQSGVKQVDLFANDVKVASLTSAPYNFALNTANYTNGPVSVFARASNSSNQTTDTAIITLTAFNRVAPVLAIASPANGSTITNPSLPVQISINKKNSGFTVSGGVVTLDLLDYRGQKVDSKTVPVSNNTDGVYTSAAFDLAKLPADTYTIRGSMIVVLDGVTTTTVEAVSQITTNTTSVNPPASVVRLPITLANGTNATIVSGSGFLVNVSDDTGVQYVQVRFVNRDGTLLNNSYLLNQGFDAPPKLADIVIPNLDIDGSQYVPDGDYNIRVTVADTSGNRNVQEVPVTVKRIAATNTYTQLAVTTPGAAKPNPGQLTYDNGTWTLSGVNNASRVAAVLYKDGKVIGTRVESGVSGNQSLNYTFGDIGSYEVDWIVEDLTTGVVKYVTGTAIGVSRNP